ncbi:hypothetical protein MKX03_037940, partial [Papaver bracteatum]
RKKLDLKNFKGLKPTKIKNKEGEEEFYGYGYTGKYLNNGEPIDFENNHGQLPNFGTRKPVELQPNNLGYNQYIGMNYPPSNYGPSSRADWDYGTTDPNFRYHRDARRKAVEHADSFCTDLFRLPPPPPPQPPQPPRRGRIPLFYGF